MSQMSVDHDHRHGGHGGSPNRVAALATLHCLTGCAIGEVVGMVVGTALGLSNPATIGLAVVLAFVFGYSLTMLPLVRAGLALSVALPLAFASDSISIAVMEIADNGVVLAVPGAMDAGLADPLFWGALAFSLVVAFVVAFPLNRYLIARGMGHAVVHAHHAGGGAPASAGSPWKLVALGVAAVVVTVVVAVGGALIVESARQDDHARAAGAASVAAPAPQRAQWTWRWKPPNMRPTPKTTTASTATTYA